MSRRRKQRSSRAASWREARWVEQLEVAEHLEDRWYDEEEMAAVDALPGARPVPWHLVACPTSGEIHGRPICGRFQAEPREKIERQLALLEELLPQSCSGAVPPGPCWLRLEFLDNILDCELQPPCGCPPAAGLRRFPALGAPARWSGQPGAEAPSMAMA